MPNSRVGIFRRWQGMDLQRSGGPDSPIRKAAPHVAAVLRHRNRRHVRSRRKRWCRTSVATAPGGRDFKNLLDDGFAAEVVGSRARRPDTLAGLLISTGRWVRAGFSNQT